MEIRDYIDPVAKKQGGGKEGKLRYLVRPI
jgi:hypothetical protein